MVRFDGEPQQATSGTPSAAVRPGSTGLSHALASGQAARILSQAPAAQREAAVELAHRAAIAGLHGALWTAGITGIVAGLAVLALVRGPVSTHPPATAATPPTAVPQH